MEVVPNREITFGAKSLENVKTASDKPTANLVGTQTIKGSQRT
jgi:hypothetical protein